MTCWAVMKKNHSHIFFHFNWGVFLSYLIKAIHNVIRKAKQIKIKITILLNVQMQSKPFSTMAKYNNGIPPIPQFHFDNIIS